MNLLLPIILILAGLAFASLAPAIHHHDGREIGNLTGFVAGFAIVAGLILIS